MGLLSVEVGRPVLVGRIVVVLEVGSGVNLVGEDVGREESVGLEVG